MCFKKCFQILKQLTVVSRRCPLLTAFLLRLFNALPPNFVYLVRKYAGKFRRQCFK